MTDQNDPPDLTPGSDNGEDEPADRMVERRQRAQDAAGDLARMGIDPRSLGLLGPGEPPRSGALAGAPGPAPADPAADEGGSVLPLRPEFGAPAPSEPMPIETAPAQVDPPAARTRPGPARSDVPRLLRSVARGLVTPDAALASQDERTLVETVRQRQSERRIVAFIAGKGGVGCTTLAAAVGTTLMAMRDDRTVLIDVQQGSASLGTLLGAVPPMRITELVARAEVVDPPTAPSGLGVVDGTGWDQETGRRDVSAVLERLGSEHVFHLLDIGRDTGPGAHSALARADQVVVVTGPGEIGAAALGRAVERVREVNPAAVDRIVTAIVCPYEENHRETVRELAPAGLAGRVVVVPPEPVLRGGTAYDAGIVSRAVREAVLRIAAGVVAR